MNRNARSSLPAWPRKHYIISLLILYFLVYHCILSSAEQGNSSHTAGIWPLEGSIQIGAQFHDFQDYSKVPYFHGGLDIRGPAGTSVCTPVSGRVTLSSYKIEATKSPLRFAYVRTPFKPGHDLSSRYIELRIATSDGTSWYFRHLDPGSIPYQLLRHAENNTEISAGSLIGNIVPWSEAVLPVAEKYDHIHLEILGPDGSYLNPAAFLPPVPDAQPPVIHGLWAVPNEELTAFEDGQSCPVVCGDIDFVMAVTDTISGGQYLYSPYRVRASIRSLSGTKSTVIPPADVFLFDRLPIKGDRTQLATVIYREQLKTSSGTIKSNGSGGPRFFLMNLTNGNPALGYKAEYALRTVDLPDGSYALDVEAFDIAGNIASRTLEFSIRNSR